MEFLLLRLDGLQHLQGLKAPYRCAESDHVAGWNQSQEEPVAGDHRIVTQSAAISLLGRRVSGPGHANKLFNHFMLRERAWSLQICLNIISISIYHSRLGRL